MNIMMTSCIKKESPVRGVAAKPLMKTPGTGGFVVREREYRGVRFSLVKVIGGLIARIGPEATDSTALIITHPDGRAFRHTQSAIGTAKTVIRWHHKFGGWRTPK